MNVAADQDSTSNDSVQPEAVTRRSAALVRHGISLHPEMTTDVNEQNLLALGFYEKMGFKRTARSSLDGQGRPYPIIHMRYVGA